MDIIFYHLGGLQWGTAGISPMEKGVISEGSRTVRMAARLVQKFEPPGH
jgi:hypothetical protein